MKPRVTLTRNRMNRVRIGLAGEDFALVKLKLARLAADESACQRSVKHTAEAEALERFANALFAFEPHTPPSP